MLRKCVPVAQAWQTRVACVVAAAADEGCNVCVRVCVCVCIICTLIPTMMRLCMIFECRTRETTRGGSLQTAAGNLRAVATRFARLKTASLVPLPRYLKQEQSI